MRPSRVQQPAPGYPVAPSQNGRGDLPERPEAQVRSVGKARKVLWAAVVLGAVLAGAVVLGSAGSKGMPVLAAAHSLAPGDTISAADLTSVTLKVSGGSVSTIPAAQRASVVGERVTGPLSAGSLLSPASVTSKGGFAPGQLGIALALAPDRAAQGILAVGESVLVVGAPSQQAGGTQATATAPVPMEVPAGVLSIEPGPASSGQVIVDLVLSSRADAAAVTAAMATQNGVRLVVVPSGS